MEKRRKRLDSLFEIALVLLGILSAAEFQYFLTVEEERLYFYALRVYTVPFVVLIVFWLVKELISDTIRPEFKMLLTEFSWEFLSLTLFYFLLGIYGGLQIGIVLSFLLSILMSLTVMRAYGRASPIEKGDRSMHDYYKSSGWMSVRVMNFVGAYILLVLIVFPWGL